MSQVVTKKDVQEIVERSFDTYTVKLFKYLDKRFGEVDRKLDDHDERFKEVLGSIAELAGDLKTYHAELLALGYKVDRLERWKNLRKKSTTKR